MDRLKSACGWAPRAVSPGIAEVPHKEGLDPHKQNRSFRSLESDINLDPADELPDMKILNAGDYDVEELKKRLIDEQKRNGMLDKEKAKLQGKYAQLKARYQGLAKKSKEVHANYNSVKAARRRNQVDYNNRVLECNGVLEKERTKNTALEKENRTLKTQLSRSQAEQAESKRCHRLAEETVTKCEQQIIKLTETISRSSQRDDTRQVTRDDDYFATEFGELANAIQQWVFRHFRSASNQRFETLDPLLQKSFEITTLKAAPLKTSRAHLDAISAIVAHQLTSPFFEKLGLLRVADLQDPFLTIFDCIAGTDSQQQTWRAQTLNMIFKRDSFITTFNENVKIMTQSLEKPFGDLAAKSSREDQRNRGLHSLVERTAKLAMEVAQQHSKFELYSVTPGNTFDPQAMEDAVEIVDEDGKGRQNGIVRVLLFPAILRRDYSQKGNFREGEVLVLKAKVLADFCLESSSSSSKLET